jgi:hypothetical protein
LRFRQHRRWPSNPITDHDVNGKTTARQPQLFRRTASHRPNTPSCLIFVSQRGQRPWALRPVSQRSYLLRLEQPLRTFPRTTGMNKVTRKSQRSTTTSMTRALFARSLKQGL